MGGGLQGAQGSETRYRGLGWRAGWAGGQPQLLVWPWAPVASGSSPETLVALCLILWAARRGVRGAWQVSGRLGHSETRSYWLKFQETK